MVTPGCPLGRPGLRPVFFRSDCGAGLPSPSDDGGLPEFFEFCLTRAARSATCARSSSSSASRPAMRASRPASSSRSRAFDTRSPAITSSGESVSPVTQSASGTSRTLPQPTLVSNTNTQPTGRTKENSSSSSRLGSDLTSYCGRKHA